MACKMITLNNSSGVEIPALGLGTWQSAPGEVRKAVSHALRNGYTHIDCAFCYANEDEVGEGLREAFDTGIKREDIFITSKVWCTFSSRVEECLDLSLKSLGLDYVDLYLIHWPVAMNPHGRAQWTGNDVRFPKLPDGSRDLDLQWSHTQTWKQMEALLQTGKTRAIGVCNYSVRYLEQLLEFATIPPAVNQIENHPSLPQNEIVDYCKSKGIHTTAYSPLGSTGSPLMKDSAVLEIAQKHSVESGTVLLSYHRARGSSVLAKSVTPSRIDQNKVIIDLDTQDIEKLENIYKRTGLNRYVYPAFGIDFGFPDRI